MRPDAADRVGALAQRHLARAYHLALRCTGDASLAEDAVQDAFAGLLARPPDEIGRELPAGYVLRTVHSSAVNLKRREAARRRREEGYAMSRASRKAGAAVAAGTREIAAAARAALAELPSEMRVAIALCCEQGLPQEEAARIAGVPRGTLARRVQRGLERLRRALAASGFAALAPAALAGQLGSLGLPAVPAGLGAKLGALAAGAKAGTASGATAAAAKGGIAMKAIAGIVAAGALAGAVAVSTGAFQRDGGSGPLASPGGTGKPAPVNPYNGMQEREEVFEFTQKPAVTKQGDKWVITFASKGRCDATVSILDKDGRIIRHLASGVLGKNAPWPFQQNSLSQSVEWDGLTDDFGKAPAECKVKVSLGLKAEFERGMAWDPYDMPNPDLVDRRKKKDSPVMLGAGADGATCVATAFGRECHARLYDKDWKYLRTVFPPSAADVEKILKPSFKFNATVWGDKVAAPTWFGPLVGHPGDNRGAKTAETRWPDLFRAIKAAGIQDIKENAARPPALAQRSKVSPQMTSQLLGGGAARITVDPVREEVYASVQNAAYRVFRIDARTGEQDKSWFPKGEFPSGGELVFGPDGLLYVGRGGKATLTFRVDRDGKPVPWKAVQNTVRGPKANLKGDNSFYWFLHPNLRAEGIFLVNGGFSGSNVHERGFDVSPAGLIVSRVSQNVPVDYAPDSVNKVLDNRVPLKFAPELKFREPGGRVNLISVWDLDGNLVAWDAVEGLYHGHNLHMDRDGNLYAAQTVGLPGRKHADGIADGPGVGRLGRGCLLKFRGLGGRYPLGKFYGTNKDETPPPAEAMKLTSRGYGCPTAVTGALWAYDGVIGQGNYQSCTCHHVRNDLDGYARPWILANHLYSVMVLDSNGNRIARIGRYGNVDDNDPKCGGIHFAWPRAVCVSNVAMYVHDGGNRRILKAKLGYHAEETVNLDGTAASSAPASKTVKATPVSSMAKTDPSSDTLEKGTAPPAHEEPSAEEVCRGWWSLAMSYKRAGRKDKAREYLEKVIEAYPGTEYAARARSALASL